MVSVAGVEVATGHWIGGQRVGSAATFEDVSPIDGTVIAQIARGGADEAAQAVAAAKAAFPAWAATPPAERARILHAIADGVEKRIDDLAIVETTDNGALIRSHRRGRDAAGGPQLPLLRRLPGRRPAPPGLRDPRPPQPRQLGPGRGRACSITPWNAPLMLATWKVAPALAAGNTVVLKPSEWSPLTASLLADIAREAGLPDGVLNVVQGFGAEAGAALVADPASAGSRSPDRCRRRSPSPPRPRPT